jgi:hypothetical protein
MDVETLLGTILIAAWAAVVLRGLVRTALAARKGRQWERAYLVDLGVGCTFGVGVVLSIKNSLPLDTFGLSFFLAAGAGCDLGLGSKCASRRKEGTHPIKTAERGGGVAFDGVTEPFASVERDGLCSVTAPHR